MTKKKPHRLTGLLNRDVWYYLESGWGDSNSRPPAPKAGALTGLRYTPKIFFWVSDGT